MREPFSITANRHDTLRYSQATSATVRFQTDYFVGKQVLHCHILDHGASHSSGDDPVPP